MIVMLTALALAAPTWRHAAAVDDDTVLLWNLYDAARMDRLEVASGRTVPVPTEDLAWVIAVAPAGDDVWALDRRGEDVWLVRHDGSQWSAQERVSADSELVAHSGHAALVTRDEAGWDVVLLHPDRREPVWVDQPERPLDWGRGWVAGQRAIRRGDAVWFWRAGYEPTPWAEPPPLWAHSWPERWLPLADGTWLASGAWAVHHIAGDQVHEVLRHKTGPRYPADGPAREAAIASPEPAFLLGERVVLWELGGQRLLELRHADAWTVHTLWASPVQAVPVDAESLQASLSPPRGQYHLSDYRPHLERAADFAALPEAVDLSAPWLTWEDGTWRRWESRVLAWNVHDRAGRSPEWRWPDAAEASAASTTDEILAAWSQQSWEDVSQDGLAAWRLAHLQELEVLRNDPAAGQALLAADSAGAAYALALLGTPGAKSRMQRLVRDPTHYAWETGCTFPRATVGAIGLEHVTGKALGKGWKPIDAERERYEALARTAATLEGMDGRCGEPGHAVWLLDRLE